MTDPNEKGVLETVEMPDGRRFVILDWSQLERGDASNNLYLLARDGRVLWQVSSKFDSDGGPFTKIVSHDRDKLVAYRWDGGDYEIDAITGFATPGAFKK